MTALATPLAETGEIAGIDLRPAWGLPSALLRPARPTPVATPSLIVLNDRLAARFGLDSEWLARDEGVALLAGNSLPPDASPLALAYAGHKFGHFVPSLGDGRALLLGALYDEHGHAFDLQLKGSGLTPFSRGGDGRAPLASVLREYLISEAVAALGVPTTRALAALSTGETLRREGPEPGGLLLRVAASHVRVGSFQYLAARNDRAGLAALADFVLERHYPGLKGEPQPYFALLRAIAERQARLVADWMLLGFVHGVVNTDNVLVSGETIDYGPCAFLDAYEPASWFSSIDHDGRYAYADQPTIAAWNLARLAESFAPLLAEQQYKAMALAQSAVAAFEPAYDEAFLAGMRRKLGLFTVWPGDRELAQALLKLLADNAADFTLSFRHLADAIAGETDSTALRRLFIDQRALDNWLAAWRARLAADPAVADRAERMRQANPWLIPRNHHVEAAIKPAVKTGDFAPFRRLLAALATPFIETAGAEGYAVPPTAEERISQTFCGT